MKKRGLLSVLLLITVWIIAGTVVDNPIKLPSFFDVISKMGELAVSFTFYEAFAYTLMRSLSGLAIALGCALVLGIAAGLNKHFEEYFEPIYIILKSIPNISYILVVLIWSSSDFTMRVISFMVMFPMAYANILSGMKNIDSDYLDVLKIYPCPKIYALTHVYLPLISSYIYASLSNGIGLTFKVGIMAEIMGSVSPGVGRQFQLCRINVDMVSTFAWTAWLILILMLLEYLVKQIKKIKRDGQ